MRRRELVFLIGGAAAWPVAVRAQQTLHRIGILLGGGPELLGEFRQALRELGYVEGQNTHIEVRAAEGFGNRLPELAAELVRSKVDIIVASLTPAVMAAKNATRDIPIVMAPAGDPVGTGLVASLSRPGGNITGLSGIATELAPKVLDLIREVLPRARRVAVLGNAEDPFGKVFVAQIQQGAVTVGFEIQPLMVRAHDDLDSAFATFARHGADAVIMQSNLPVQATADLALKYRLPALAIHRSMAQAGALMSYNANYPERGREVAAFVDKILKGAKPADLSVAQPSRFELVVNLKTAKALGLTMPESLLARADEVIE